MVSFAKARPLRAFGIEGRGLGGQYRIRWTSAENLALPDRPTFPPDRLPHSAARRTLSLDRRETRPNQFLAPLAECKTKGVGAGMPAANRAAKRGNLHKLVVTNFKSYAGELTIGPFKDFTCVIGPNGSGMSLYPPHPKKPDLCRPRSAQTHADISLPCYAPGIATFPCAVHGTFRPRKAGHSPPSLFAETVCALSLLAAPKESQT